MTRYARATGSKSSNVRTPNEPTPWHIMKQQLGENKTKNHQSEKKVKSAKELLKEKEDPFYYDTKGDLNNWAEFEEVGSLKLKKKLAVESPKLNKSEATIKLSQKKIKKQKQEIQIKKDDIKTEYAEQQNKASITKVSQHQNQNTEKTSKKKRKKNTDGMTDEIFPNNTLQTADKSLSVKYPNKRQKIANEDQDKNIADTEDKLTKRQKRNLKKKNKNSEDSNHICTDQNLRFYHSISAKQTGMNFNTKKIQRPGKNNHLTPAKVRDDHEHKRRKPVGASTKLMINGIEVEISTFDGFPVKKEDAERLQDLRKQMIMKGIPKTEMEAALKLERRRAEKALTRIKKEVCYHCRKSGHILSDCPELGREEVATGICFKCGSTEHTHFECKVTRSTEFRFAKCFICREQGHIAKQCPDNPKGVYPQGGACKICGDVTHLKKDCPDLIKEKEETTLTVDTIECGTADSLGNEIMDSKKRSAVIGKNIVKF